MFWAFSCGRLLFCVGGNDIPWIPYVSIDIDGTCHTPKKKAKKKDET